MEEKNILEQFLPNQKYYEFNTRGVCQVLVTEKIMRKMAKIIYKADAEIKNLLHNADEGDVVNYAWSLSNVKDENDNILKQKVFTYAEFGEWCSLKDRINNITLGVPTYSANFYVIKNQEELKKVETLITKELMAENELRIKEN